MEITKESLEQYEAMGRRIRTRVQTIVDANFKAHNYGVRDFDIDLAENEVTAYVHVGDYYEGYTEGYDFPLNWIYDDNETMLEEMKLREEKRKAEERKRREADRKRHEEETRRSELRQLAYLREKYKK